MNRVLITGSRDWTDRRKVWSEIVRYISETCPMGTDSRGESVDWDTRGLVIVHGACLTGADNFADEYGVVNWINVERHPARWNEFGKSAGFIRNQHMVNLGADICLAFIKNGSRGATHTAELAELAGIEVRRFIVCE